MKTWKTKRRVCRAFKKGLVRRVPRNKKGQFELFG